ncbi:hypothetical protein SAMN06295967_105239 [Belliella buryatensis]|uniref:Uncharacterized protein n=1 Tax=Belliella buryatensis TaxID=1500549 RepID=A0A239CWP6_9BACT|nr:hypothetical protein SAMN06295967_105239 [Belliella buryatensis]
MIKNSIYYLKRSVEYSFIVYSNRNLKGFREKSKAARTLISLNLKSIGRNKEEQTTVKFFDFKITGLNAASLLYLFQEIFLNQEYFF